MHSPAAITEFNHSPAQEYATHSRIALAGYDACHELSACLLSAHLGDADWNIVVGGASAPDPHSKAIPGRLLNELSRVTCTNSCSQGWAASAVRAAMNSWPCRPWGPIDLAVT